jgi:hypothetical protein
VGQELLSTQYHALSHLYFWARDKKESSAEVDYIFPFEGKLIPVEVKSGSEGKLKSLQIYMDMAPHTMAVRFYAGEISITKAATGKGKKYHLLNLPYYLVTSLEAYLRWFEQQIEK